MLLIAFIAASLLLPLASRRRWPGPAAPFAAVALAHLGLVASAALWRSLSPGSFGTALAIRVGRATPYHDSYFTLANTGAVLVPLAFWAGLAAAAWLAHRTHALFAPGALWLGFWLLNLATCGGVLTFGVRLGAGAPVPGWTERLDVVCAAMALAGLALLAATFARGAWRRGMRGERA